MNIQEVEIYKISPIKKLQEKMTNFLSINTLSTPISQPKTPNKEPTKEIKQTAEVTSNAENKTENTLLTMQLVGTINGNIRLLELRNPITIASSEIIYSYTIKGMGNREKDKKCTLNIQSNTIYFETLGKGTIATKNKLYQFTSEQNEWELTQRQ
jgi:hypothetical protein